MLLFDPARHEPLTATRWDEASARAAIAKIVADLEGQFDAATLWPSHPREREPGEADVPNPMLYNGAAGVVWALRRLQQKGVASSGLDLAAIAASLPAHSRRWTLANESEPASYFLGHSAVLLLQWSFERSPAVADELYTVVEGNLRNKAREALWGSPGTLLAALHLLEATHDERWRSLFRRGVGILWDEMEPVRHSAHPDREVWIWVQDLYGKITQYFGAGHGFAGNVFPVLRGASWLDDDLVARFESRALEALEVAADRDGDLVGWDPMFDRSVYGYPRKPLVQDCHGAPGIVCRLAHARPPALRSLLLQGGELTWHAGPLSKRPGLCHGTDGNGYAFLKLYRITGETLWLERARAFAMHAIGQSDALAAEHGRRVPSLWTGDAGLAVYLAACLDGDDALPALDVF